MKKDRLINLVMQSFEAEVKNDAVTLKELLHKDFELVKVNLGNYG